MTGASDDDPIIQFLTFASIEDAAAIEAGGIIDGYRVLEEVGAGGSGVVFRAKHIELDREVALKVSHTCNEPSTESASDEDSYQQEARILAELRHPNLVPVYDAGIHVGRRWLAMQYVPGTKLRPIASVEQAAATLRKLAAALGTAHASGIAHGDLRPANVVLSPSGEPMLIDFSLATASNHAQTKPPSPLGTPRYWAPEQHHGYGASIAADVYSFGLLALYTLTGKIEPRALKRSSLPRSLRAILQRCLARRAEERYANAAEIADELRRFLANESVLADPRGTAAHLALAIRRRPGRAVATFVVVTLFLVSLVLWQHQRVLDSRLKSAQLQDSVDEGYALFDRGELPKLFAMHKNAEAQLQDDPRWQLLIAGATLWTRRYSDAVALYSTYEADFPNDVGAEYAAVALAIDQSSKGISRDESAVRSDTPIQSANFQEALLRTVAHARWSQREQTRATEWAARGLELRPACYPLLLLQGTGFVKAGYRSQGTEILIRASEIAPLPMGAQERLIQSLISSSRLEEARQRIELTLESCADHPYQKLRMYIFYSQFAVQAGSHSHLLQAHSLLRQGQEGLERTFSSEFALSKLEILLGRWESAATRLEQLESRLLKGSEVEIPQLLAARYRARVSLLRGQLLAARANTNDALEAFDALLASEPQDWIANMARLDRIACLSLLGQSEQALAAIDHELDRGAGFELGTRLAVRCDNLEYASTIAKRGLAADPHNPRRVATDSYVAFATGDLHQSMVQAANALHADPESTQFRLWQAYVLARNSDLAQSAGVSIDKIRDLSCWLAWDRIVQIATLIELGAVQAARQHFDQATRHLHLSFLQEAALQLPGCPAELRRWLQDTHEAVASD